VLVLLPNCNVSCITLSLYSCIASSIYHLGKLDARREGEEHGVETNQKDDVGDQI
jgi:hypothetical protein